MKSVKRQSFFDRFYVFPVGAASGAQAKSLSDRKVKGEKASKGL
jgi:hypothetical protein